MMKLTITLNNNEIVSLWEMGTLNEDSNTKQCLKDLLYKIAEQVGPTKKEGN